MYTMGPINYGPPVIFCVFLLCVRFFERKPNHGPPAGGGGGGGGGAGVHGICCLLACGVRRYLSLRPMYFRGYNGGRTWHRMTLV